MMSYYRANFPREPYTPGAFLEVDRIKEPVLQFHGLADTALLAKSLNNTCQPLAAAVSWLLDLVAILRTFYVPHIKN